MFNFNIASKFDSNENESIEPGPKIQNFPSNFVEIVEKRDRIENKRLNLEPNYKICPPIPMSRKKSILRMTKNFNGYQKEMIKHNVQSPISNPLQFENS